MRAAFALSLCAVTLLSCTSGDARPKAKPPAAAATAPAAAPQASPAGVVPAGLRRAAAFSSERAWKHLEDQMALGPRAHGSPGHEKLRALLADHLRACGAEVAVHDFTHQGAEDVKPQPMWNVIGRFNPKAERWVMIGTHYDTRRWADEDKDPAMHSRPIAGANDGGSGTAVLMEIATVLKEIPPDLGVTIVFFDGEDYGRNGRFGDYFLGSTALARDWPRYFGDSKPECLVVLDMVADADLAFRRETKSQAQAPWVSDALWATGKEMGIPAFGVPGDSPIYDDQDAFLALGIPAALLIDYEYPWWHTAGDTLDKCAPSSLAATGRVVLATLVDRAPPARPAAPAAASAPLK